MHKNLMNKSHQQVVVDFATVVGFFMYFIENGRGGVFGNNAVQPASKAPCIKFFESGRG